jgi:hypothetical protein
MPRSVNDILLLAGAFVAILATLVVALFHPGQDTAGPALLLGGTISFFCALVAVGTDLQDSVKVRLGDLAGTSILSTWQGWASLALWGCFTVFMFQFVVQHPAWATSTFLFKVSDNLLATGFVVGISAIVIIRSKLAKVGNVEWGVEWVYLWSSAQVLNAVNQKRIRTVGQWKRRFKPLVTDVVTYPNLFTDLESHMSSLLNGKSAKTQTAVSQEFTRLRVSYIPAGNANADATINANLLARQYIVSVILDHLGPDDLSDWAKTQGATLD